MSPWDFPLTLNILDTMTTILHQIWGCSGYSNAWITTWYTQMRNIRYWVASRCTLLIDKKIIWNDITQDKPIEAKETDNLGIFPNCRTTNSYYETHMPAGGHPSVKEGEVRRTINFQWTSGISQWSTTAQVVNCGRFYVYHLKESPVCSLVYCGEGSNLKGETRPEQYQLSKEIPKK